jgi:ABC-type amino acid transport substrate-binding protein/signal transduction histidine kinase
MYLAGGEIVRNRLIILSIFFVVATSLFLPASLAFAAKATASQKNSNKRQPLHLTTSELEFIKSHPQIRFSNIQAPPLSIIQPDAGYSGVLADYAKRIEELTGLHFVFTPIGPGQDLDVVLAALKERQIDMINGVTRTQEQMKYALAAGPCFQFPITIFSRKGSLIRTTGQLAGKRVVETKDSYALRFLRNRHPSLPLIVVDSPEQALRMISNNLADASLGDQAVMNYSIMQQNLRNVAATGLSGALGEYYSLTRKDWPTLAAILQKAHDAISADERADIARSWIPQNFELVGDEVDLTEAQRSHLAHHPIITASNEMTYPPFNYNVGGQPKGYSIELLDLLADKLGVKVKWVSNKSWNEFLQMLRSGELDVMCNMASTPDRRKHYTFTESYTALQEGIAYQEGQKKPSDIEDLSGKVAGVTKGYNEEEALRRYYPKVKVKTFPSTLDALRALANGEVDAVLDSLPTIQFLCKQYFITNVSAVGLTKNIHFPAVAIHFGVKRNNTMLRDILDKAMESLGPDEWSALSQRTLGDQVKQTKSMRLSKAELERLSSSRFITMCVNPHWPPYEELTKDGKHEGMIADTMKLMSDRIGIPIQVVPTTSFRASMEYARNHLCDIVSAVNGTPDQKSFLSLSAPYLEFPYVIVTRSDEMFIEDLNKLGRRRLGLRSGSPLESTLLRHYPDLKIESVDSIYAGLEKVSSGELFGMVGDIPTISKAIQKTKLYNLKVAGKLPTLLELCVGVRDDDPTLLSIFNKAVKTISPEEKASIQKNWISVTFEHEFDYTLLWKVIAGAVLVIVVVIYWNRKLTRLNRAVSQAKDELEKAHGKLAALLDNSGQCFMSVGEDAVVDMECSQECSVIFEGPVAGERLGDLLDAVPGLAPGFVAANVQRILAEEDEFRQNAYLSLLPAEMKVHGKLVQAQYRILPQRKLMLVLTDITERRRLEEALDRERRRLTFVVSTVKDAQEFFEILDDFEAFMKKEAPVLTAKASLEQEELAELYRRTHTLKGLLLQLDFPSLPNALNNLETTLGSLRNQGEVSGEELTLAFKDADLQQYLAYDLELLKDSLGPEFFQQRGQIILPQSQIRELERLAESLLSQAQKLGLDQGELKLLEGVRRLRRVPLRRLLAGYPKAAIQLAERLGKSVKPFDIEGGERAVDPEVFSPLTKSLVHIFRNAVDHGLESPEEREDLGKPEQGELRCRIREQNAQIVIEIEDDGQGVDLEALRSKAVLRGILQKDQAREIGESDLLRLVFLDGFSTSEEASVVSGHGVGLAAVQAEASKLSGRIDIATEQGRYTRVSISLPL